MNKLESRPIPIFFSEQLAWRTWLDDHHASEREILVGFYKVATGKPSMTWSESVDQALCYGWIDGVRRSIDKDSYCIRFTPRKSNSIWSKVNIDKVQRLTELGLMQPPGVAAFSLRSEERSEVYSFESKAKELSDEYGKQFIAEKDAWEYFTRQSPSYQRTIIHWIMTAKQEETRQRRLRQAINISKAGDRLL